MSARRKPLYFTISTMFQILTTKSPGDSNSARDYVNKFKKHTEINKTYDKIVRKFNKSNGKTLKIKRCNFHYDQYGNPIEDPKEKNPWGFQQFKVINTGKVLETEDFPVIALIEFTKNFLEELAKEVDLSDVYYYPNWSRPNLEYVTGWPNENLAKEIRINAFCSLASISNPYAIKNQPAYQPLIKFLKQRIGLSNNLADLKSGLKNGTFMEKAELNPIKLGLDKNGKLIMFETYPEFSVIPNLIEAIALNIEKNNKADWHKRPEVMLEIIANKIRFV